MKILLLLITCLLITSTYQEIPDVQLRSDDPTVFQQNQLTDEELENWTFGYVQLQCSLTCIGSCGGAIAATATAIITYGSSSGWAIAAAAGCSLTCYKCIVSVLENECNCGDTCCSDNKYCRTQNKNLVCTNPTSHPCYEPGQCPNA